MTANSEEYRHLVELRCGNSDSFRWLYDKYFQQVYSFCISLVRIPQDAEELTSEVFLIIWKKRRIIQADHQLKPLLFKICKDLTWNHLKRIARDKEHRGRYQTHYALRSYLHGEEVILFREYQNTLKKAIAKLTPQQQKVFQLRFFQGWDLNQIAAELHISKNTVKVHLAKSKRFVMSCLTLLLAVSYCMLLF